MGVQIDQMVGTVQQPPEGGSAQARTAPRQQAPSGPTDEQIRAFLIREAQLVARVRAD